MSAYFVLLCFQMTYGKMMTNAMKYSLSSTVLYNNALAIPPMFLLGVCSSLSHSLSHSFCRSFPLFGGAFPSLLRSSPSGQPPSVPARI